MLNRVKITGILFLVVALLALAGCGEKTPEEKFISQLKADREAGFSFGKIAWKIDGKYYAGMRDSTDELIQEIYEEYPEVDYEAEEAAQLELVQNIKNRNCPAVFKGLGLNQEDLANSEDFLIGIFFEEGICVEKDPAKALKIYLKNFEEYPFKNVSARLGNLYLKGEGAQKDLELADFYFTQAVMTEPAYFWFSNNPLFNQLDQETLSYKLWGLTDNQLEVAFAEQETGPWDIPEPLMEKVAWVTSLAQDNGQGAVDVARNLLAGTGGFEKDTDLGFTWLERAGDYLENSEARFEAAFMRMSPDFCPKSFQIPGAYGCDYFMSFGFEYMGWIAMDGNPEAIEFLIDYYSQNPDLSWADWDLYLLHQIAKQEGLNFSEQDLEGLKNSLSEFEQELLDAWLESAGSSLISQNLPY